MKFNLKHTKIIGLTISILVFILSLTQPAYYIDRENYNGWSDSFFLLIFGWLGVFYGGAAIAWLANPFIFSAWVLLFTKPKIALILSVIAVLFAWSFLMFDTIVSSEAPSYSKITEYKSGYWLWVCSISVFSTTALIINIISNSARLDVHSIKEPKKPFR
jgi:hypothetical protein